MLHLKCHIELFYINIILNQNKYTLTDLCEKFKIVSFASLIMKNIAVFPARSKFPVKLICCIDFG